MQTTYVVQPFNKAKRGNRLVPGVPIAARSPEHAKLVAEKMLPRVLGVVVFTQDGDPLLGEFDDAPKVLASYGTVPEEIGG